MYVFDTSAFIALIARGSYREAIFQTLWVNFNNLLDTGEIVSVREVRREINKMSDALDEWATAHSKIFLAPNTQQTEFIQRLFLDVHFQGLVRHKKIIAGDPVADPFVIALAADINGCVVTQEKWKPNAPSIPNVCATRSIECVDLLGFMEKEGWVF